MNNNTIELKPFRKQFYTYFLASIATIAISFLLHLILNTGTQPDNIDAWYLGAMLFILFAVVITQQNNKKNWQKNQDFETRLSRFYSHYKTKMILNLILSLAPSIGFVLTNDFSFLYFSLFQLIFFIWDMPTKTAIQKDFEYSKLLVN